jgi:phenylpyruvate tautomerase PptA (4-oxalocrotonate tautomerase family)
MPLMDVIHPEGAFSPEARDELLRTLWRTCLRWEAVPESDATGAISWVYLDERPGGSMTAGGQSSDDHRFYRAHVRVMSGMMDSERRAGMVHDVTDAILAADGTAGDGSGRPRVYCIIEEVPSGTWGVDGTVWPSPETAATAGADPHRVEAMRAAIGADPQRIDVPAPALAAR